MAWLALEDEITAEFDELSVRSHAVMLWMTGWSAWRNEAARERWRERKALARRRQLRRRAPIRCANEYCQVEFLALYGQRRYCTRRCQEYAARAHPTIRCANERCQTEFVALYRQRRYCTRRCREDAGAHRAHWEYQRARWKHTLRWRMPTDPAIEALLERHRAHVAQMYHRGAA